METVLRDSAGPKETKHAKSDVTRDDSQRRFLAQHSVAMLEQCCNYSKQCRNNVATLCCAKNRRCESSRVTSPPGGGGVLPYITYTGMCRPTGS